MLFFGRMRAAVAFFLVSWIVAQELPRAISALEAGRFEEAANTLTEVLRRTPDDPDANYYLGLTYFRSDRPREARPYLEKAALLSTAKPAPWKALGLTSLKLNDYPAASTALGKACTLDAADEDNCYLLGRSLFVQGRYDEAVAPFEAALRAVPAPNQGIAHRAAALNFAELGKKHEAETHFSEAIRRYRGAQPDPRVDYGAFLIGQGRAQDSLKMLRRAVQDWPASTRAHAELGRALLELDRPAEALPQLKRAVDLDPNAWNVRLMLGKTYFRLGRTGEGERESKLGREGWAKQDYGSSKVK